MPSNLKWREGFSSQPVPRNWQNEGGCASQVQEELQDRAEPERTSFQLQERRKGKSFLPFCA